MSVLASDVLCQSVTLTGLKLYIADKIRDVLPHSEGLRCNLTSSFGKYGDCEAANVSITFS